MSFAKQAAKVATGLIFSLQMCGLAQTVLGDETVEITKPAGIDLDVTYIRRTPLYNRYQVVWQDEVQTLVPGTIMQN